MKDFITLYKETINLFEEGTFENENWRDNLTSNLLMLKQVWPELEVDDLSEDLNDWTWRVKQIKKWSELDAKTIEEELYNHGSMFFLGVKDNLTEEEEEAILKSFWELTSKAKNPKSFPIFTLTTGKLKNVNKITKIKKIKSDSELVIDKLNKIKKHHWDLMFEYSKEWEIDDRFTEILKNLVRPKSTIKAKDSEYFVDILKYLIEKNYIFKIEEADKTMLNQKLTFNSIISAVENA